ncbi:MAG: exosortase/archaeosortase family protein [Candidatus Bathyarchaeia archaeon]|jgi:thaumarchaeosortase
MICIGLPIVLLIFLDFYHLQGFNYRYDGVTNTFVHWTNTYFTQTFSFDVTWKGRLFYLFFAWFLLIESAIGWNELVKKKPRNRNLVVASLVCALIPTIYVLATNFFGLDLSIMKVGHSLGIISVAANNQPSDFLHLQWPLSVEYMVFFVAFLAAIILAYKTKGLKIFSISLSLLGAISVAYMLDTVYPFGVFRPLQEVALPITASAAALFDALGYSVTMTYPVHLGPSLLPSLMVSAGGRVAEYSISWACAGVYSLLLYLLIILVFFKRTNISGFRKLSYFVIGLFGTFCSAVLRVYTIFVISLQSGYKAGMFFHNTYGELFGFTWVFVFIILIVCIERFMLVERTREGFRKISSRFGTTNGESLPG